MNIHSRIAVFLYIILVVSGMVSADTTPAPGGGAITKCMQCEGTPDKCEAKSAECKAAEAPSAGGASPAAHGSEAPTTAAAPPARLIERDEAAATTAHAGASAAAGAGAAAAPAAVKWACLTVTGKEGEEAKMWKGCGASCDDPHRKKFAVDDTCKACSDGNDCNSSVRISPIGWILLLTAMICVGLE